MANEIEVDAILEGKVTGITKFGAFVSLPSGKSGLVHISEIAYSYVSDVNEHLTVGQDVKVKVISIDENNRINLSIKRALPPPPRPASRGTGSRPQGDRSIHRPQSADHSGHPQNSGSRYPAASYSQGERPQPRSSAPRPAAPKEPQSFDDMLKQFMSDSDSKLSGSGLYTDRPSRRRNNGGRRN